MLLITLCIIMWYVLKKRKSTGKTHFMSSVQFLNSNYANGFSSHDFELTTMKGNITGIDLGMLTRTCKYLSNKFSVNISMYNFYICCIFYQGNFCNSFSQDMEKATWKLHN